MIGIIDYEMGNLGSVVNACRFLAFDADIIRDAAAMAQCDALILPGVGAFGDCMHNLDVHGFSQPLRDWIRADKPLLGICVGLQVLFEESEEAPGVPGLGVIPGKVRRFPADTALKVPQMGWNRLHQTQPDCPLFRDVPDRVFVYFVHSYYVDPTDQDLIAGTTDYGLDYTSMVWRGNVAAFQFHPEKSQQIGLHMLRNVRDLWRSAK